jgi:hypothetical protein
MKGKVYIDTYQTNFRSLYDENISMLVNFKNIDATEAAIGTLVVNGGIGNSGRNFIGGSLTGCNGFIFYSTRIGTVQYNKANFIHSQRMAFIFFKFLCVIQLLVIL